ncbi:MAG: Photosystem I assembly protein Ycf3 [Myxococcota bacterium]|nr:Photosystem I assembly protein Ycf3 [Myxococcota bacterium]
MARDKDRDEFSNIQVVSDLWVEGQDIPKPRPVSRPAHPLAQESLPPPAAPVPERNPELEVIDLQEDEIEELEGGLEPLPPRARSNPAMAVPRPVSGERRHVPLIAPPAPLQSPDDFYQEAVALFTREAARKQPGLSSAMLFFQTGWYQEELGLGRQAVESYQRAFELEPRVTAPIALAREVIRGAGSPEFALRLLEEELQHTSDPDRRRALLWERLMMLSSTDDYQQQFYDGVDEAIRQFPDHLPFLHLKLGMVLQDQRWPDAVRLYAELANRCTDGPLGDTFRIAAAHLFMFKLKQPEPAEALYRTVLERDPANQGARRGLTRILDEAGRHEELAELLIDESGRQPDPLRASILLQEAASIYEDKLGEPGRALGVLKSAFARTPDDPTLLITLDRLCESLGEHEFLAKVLETRAANTSDVQVLTSLFFRLASVLEGPLSRPERAIECYQKVIELSPSYLPAFQALGRLLARHARYQDLAELMHREIQAVKEPAEFAARLCKLGELYLEKIGDSERALNVYLDVLRFDPVHPTARQAVARLLQKLKRWNDLVSFHESELQHASAEQQAHLLDRIASIREERLGDTQGAIDTLLRLLELSPKNIAAIRSLARLYSASNQWDKYVGAVGKELALTADSQQSTLLMHEIASVYEEKLVNREEAITAFERLHVFNPDYLPALRALGRLYQATTRWDDLLQTYEREARITRDVSQRHSLRIRMAELLVQKLQRPRQAIIIYQQLVREGAVEMPVLRALAQLLQQHQDWEGLAEVWRAEAKLLADAGPRALLLFKLGQLFDRRLNRLDDAVAAYEEAVEVFPEFVPALRALIDLHARRGNWDQIAAQIEHLAAIPGSPSMQVAYLHRLAWMYEERIGDHSGALKALQAALRIAPDDLDTVHGLERLYSASKNDKARAIWIERLSSLARDPGFAQTGWLEAGMLRESIEEYAQAAQNYVQALKINPSNREALNRLETLYHQNDRRRSLVEVLRLKASITEGADKARILLRMANESLFHLNDPGGAAEQLEECIALDPENLPALRLLREARLRQEEWKLALETVDRELLVLEDPASIFEARMTAAALALHHLNDEESAIRHLLAATEIAPGDETAIQQLSSLFSRRKEWKRLLDLRGRRAASFEDPWQAAGELADIARLQWSQFRDAAAAAAALKKAEEKAPAHPRVLALAAAMAEERGDWSAAAEKLEAALAASQPGAAQKELHLKLGVLYHERMLNPQKAIHHLKKVMEADPRNHEAMRRLVRFAMAQGQWNEAAGYLEALLTLPLQGEERFRIHVDLCNLADRGYGDAQRALQHLRSALAIKPSDEEVVERYLNLLSTHSGGNAAYYQERARVYSACARELEGRDPDRAAAIHLKLASLFEDTLNQPERAIEHYQEALRLRPGDGEARANLALLMARNPSSQGQAVEEFRNLLKNDPLNYGALRGMFHLFESQGRKDAAFCAAMVLRGLRAGDNDTEFFLGEVKSRIPPAPARLPEEVVQSVLFPADEFDLMRALLAHSGDDLKRVLAPAMDQYGVTRKDRLRGDDPFRKAVDMAQKMLGAPDCEAFISETSRKACVAEHADPPALVLGADLNAVLRGEEMLFTAARLTARVIGAQSLVLRLPAARLESLLHAIASAALPDWTSPAADPGEVEKIREALGRKSRKVLTEAAHDFTSRVNVNYAGWILRTRLAMEQAAFLCITDLAAGVQALVRLHAPQTPSGAGADEIAQVLLNAPGAAMYIPWLVSEAFFAARQQTRAALG